MLKEASTSLSPPPSILSRRTTTCAPLQLRYLHFTLTVVNQRDPSKSIVEVK